MKTVYPNLDAEIQKQDISYSNLAKSIGISKYAMYRRIMGRTDFKLSEVIRICQILDNLDASQLFLRLNTKS